jgi:pimeloyl-ACP methyl ester carboxylesterase
MPSLKANDGADLRYETHGNGPTNLLFIHGWGGAAETWANVVRRLDGARFRSICIDLRGHGESQVSEQTFTWEQMEKDILAVADHAGAKKFILVGFSMGGKIACYLAARNALQVTSLILVATAGPGIAPVDRNFGLDACRKADDWRFNKTVFGPWFAPSHDPATVEAVCKLMARTPLTIREASAEMGLWTSIAGTVGDLRMAALLIVGDSDPAYGNAYQVAETLPFLKEAKVAAVNSGHFIPLERPGDLAELISEFAGTAPGS